MKERETTVPGPQHSTLRRVRRGRGRRLVRPLALAAAIALAASVPVSAVTVSNTWQAKIGSAGINGTAQVQAFGTGTGSVVLKLAKLKPSTLLAVVISKGTCSTVGSTVATLASIKTSSTGAAARTSALTAGQVTAINNATVAPGRIAIRVGSGTARKCGQFAVPAPAVGATITVGKLPTQIAIDPSGVWVTRSLDNRVSRIDPKTNAVVSVYSFLSDVSLHPLGFPQPVDLAAGFGSIWVSYIVFDLDLASRPTGWVVRVDAATGVMVGDPIQVGPQGFAAIGVSGEAIWVTNYGGTVSRIDPTTNTVTATIAVPTINPLDGASVAGGSPFGIVAGFESVWVSNEAVVLNAALNLSIAGHVDRIDPATNQVVNTIQIPGDPRGIAVGAGSVWVADYGTEGYPDGTVSRIDPATNSVIASIPVGTNPADVAFGGGFVWIAMAGEPTVVQIDPLTNAVKKRVSVGSTSNGIAASAHAVWLVHLHAAGDVGGKAPGTVSRINY
jgi:YVTN family beta-propeller protein